MFAEVAYWCPRGDYPTGFTESFEACRGEIVGSIFAAQKCMSKPGISHSRGFAGHPCAGFPLLVLVPARDSNQRHNLAMVTWRPHQEAR